MVNRATLRKTLVLFITIAILSSFLTIVNANTAAAISSGSSTSSNAGQSQPQEDFTNSTGEGEESTCSAAEISQTIPFVTPEEIEQEITELRQEASVAGQLKQLASFEDKSGATVKMDDNSYVRMVSGFNERDAVTILRHFSPTGELAAVRALESTNVDGKIQVTNDYSAPGTEAARCANWNSGCLGNVRRNACASPVCSWAFFNPFVAAACLVTACGTSIYNCCTKWRTPTGNLHD